MGGDERSVNVVQDVGPNFTNVVDLVEGTDGGVTKRVGRCAGRVRVGTDTSAVGDDILTQEEVRYGRALLLSPFSHGIGPALTHTTGFGGLEATASSTTGHTVGNTVSVLKKISK